MTSAEGTTQRPLPFLSPTKNAGYARTLMYLKCCMRFDVAGKHLTCGAGTRLGSILFTGRYAESASYGFGMLKTYLKPSIRRIIVRCAILQASKCRSLENSGLLQEIAERSVLPRIARPALTRQVFILKMSFMSRGDEQCPFHPIPREAFVLLCTAWHACPLPLLIMVGRR